MAPEKFSDAFTDIQDSRTTGEKVVKVPGVTPEWERPTRTTRTVLTRVQSEVKIGGGSVTVATAPGTLDWVRIEYNWVDGYTWDSPGTDYFHLDVREEEVVAKPDITFKSGTSHLGNFRSAVKKREAGVTTYVWVHGGDIREITSFTVDFHVSGSFPQIELTDFATRALCPW